MQAAGVPQILDFQTWFFLRWNENASTPDCGEDSGILGCGGALNMLCARNITGDGDWQRWWTFESCLMNNQSAIPANAPECAARARIDATALAGCVAGPTGEALLRESASKTAEAQVGFTPWLIVDGKMATQLDYLKLVCDAYDGHPAPSGCPK